MNKSLSFKLNITILVSLIISLIIYYLKIFPALENSIIIVVGIASTIPVVISALFALKNKKVSVDLLASIALFVSLINREWASVVFINLMITSARIFGDYTESRADSAIKSLLKLRPEIVKIKTKDSIIEVPLAKVKLGDLVVIEAGDLVPIDGRIVEGTGTLDQSSLTGESLPINVVKGDQVLSSTVNVSGSIIVRTEKVGKDTTLEKIVLLIQNAQSSKSAILGSADRFATIYVIVALFGSITLFIFTRNLTLILSVLLVACADDIAIAIPMAFWASIAKAAKKGIVIKGANFVEALASVTTAIMDKTGTLTRGVVTTQHIIPFGTITKNHALTLLSSAESVSEHPIAKAITRQAKSLGLKVKTPEKFKEYSSKGIIAFHQQTKITVGNLKFIKAEKVAITTDQITIAQNYEAEGYDVIFMGLDNKLAALVTLADQVRPDAKPTLAKLKALGVTNFIMLTGDNEKVAKRVAQEVGISSFHANLLPQDKLKFVKSYTGTKNKVIMIGDGVNDAAALKAADIGIAMGIGTDVAIEAADITLINKDLKSVASAIELSKKTMRTIKMNLFWAFGYNIILIPVAMGILYPSFHILLNPIFASVAMATSSVSVVSNSLFLKRSKI